MPVVINGSTGISGADGSAGTPAVQGTDTNTGIYFPGADRIGFAEGGVQVGEFDASSNFLFNSGYGSVAIAYGCRAWVNFNGTGTPAIRTSGNVSSITDNGTGNYTINFSTAMPDINYAAVGSASSGGDGFLIVCSFNSRSGSIVAPTTSAFRVYTRLSGTNSDNDPEYVYVSVHR